MLQPSSTPRTSTLTSCVYFYAALAAVGAARTPPMGWGSWIQHSWRPTAAILKKAADDMVSYGLKDAGCE